MPHTLGNLVSPHYTSNISDHVPVSYSTVCVGDRDGGRQMGLAVAPRQSGGLAVEAALEAVEAERLRLPPLARPQSEEENDLRNGGNSRLLGLQ